MPTADLHYCLNYGCDQPLASMTPLWEAADRGGADWVGIADTPLIMRDLYVGSTYALGRLRGAGVMSTVTNPVSRHPAVMANSLMSMAELAPGRVACGIGTGDSAMWMMGLKAASVARLRAYVVAVRGLLRGQEVEFDGRRFAPRWVDWDAAAPPPPVYVAAAGPRVLRMGAAVADGLIVNLGYSPEILEHCRRIIDEGAAEAGRDPAEIDVWWQTSINFADSVEAARERSLGIFTAWMTKGSLEGKLIPEEMKAPLIQFNHDIEHPSRYTDGRRDLSLVERAKQMGLYDWLRSLAPGLDGQPADVARRLHEYAEQGMRRWVFYVGQYVGDRLAHTELFTNGVVPELERLRAARSAA